MFDHLQSRLGFTFFKRTFGDGIFQQLGVLQVTKLRTYDVLRYGERLKGFKNRYVQFFFRNEDQKYVQGLPFASGTSVDN